MELDRRRLLLGFYLTLAGLLLAVLVVDVIPDVPQPPPCQTATCNAAYLVDLVGLLVIIVGMVTLAVALFRGRTRGAEPPAGSPNPPYSFLPAGAPLAGPGGKPPSAPSTGPSRAATDCPGCGAPITSDYGFCPRCGRTLSR